MKIPNEDVDENVVIDPSEINFDGELTLICVYCKRLPVEDRILIIKYFNFLKF